MAIIPGGQDVSIAVAVFDEATLFPIRGLLTNGLQESDTTLSETIVGSQVISIQVAGVEDGTPLDVPIELFFSLNQIKNDTNIESPVCVFWDYMLAGK